MMLTVVSFKLLDGTKIFCLILVNFCSLGFAGFADLPAAKGTYFAGAGGKRNYRQNGMYSFVVLVIWVLCKLVCFILAK